VGLLSFRSMTARVETGLPFPQSSHWCYAFWRDQKYSKRGFHTPGIKQLFYTDERRQTSMSDSADTDQLHREHFGLNEKGEAA
jgi:hypothetical protein